MLKSSKLFFFSFIFIVFTFSLISSDPYSESDIYGTPKSADITTAINYSTVSVNSSNLWDTNEGLLDNVADILGSWLNNNLGWISWANAVNGTLALNSSLSSYLLNTGDTATGNYTFDTNTFFLDSTNNKIGIGTSNPS